MHDVFFWLSAIGAGAVKLILSPWAGAWHSAASFAAAVFFGVVFADPVLSYFNLAPDVYRNAVVAIVTLTGEGIARWVIKVASDPKRIADILASFRGGGK